MMTTMTTTTATKMNYKPRGRKLKCILHITTNAYYTLPQMHTTHYHSQTVKVKDNSYIAV